MLLPKYECFSLIGIINIIIGIYIYKWLMSLGIGLFASVVGLMTYHFVIIILYENLRIELKKEVEKEGSTNER